MIMLLLAASGHTTWPEAAKDIVGTIAVAVVAIFFIWRYYERRD